MFLTHKHRPLKLNDGFLYHFTTAESLMKILQKMTLKLSTFENLNDLNETDVNCSYPDPNNHLKIKKYITAHCKLLSFSQNFQSENGQCEYGINHPRMWAQYSNNNKGVCIVINEKLFLEKNKIVLQNIFSAVENVDYAPYIFDGNISTINYLPEDFVKNYFKHLFFKKHTDWKNEDERRFFCIDGPNFLSIDDCVEFICLGSKFSKEDYQKLALTLTTINNSCYLKLSPDDFAQQTNFSGRIVPLDIAGRIVDEMKVLKNGAKEYLEKYDKIRIIEVAKINH